MTEYSDGRPVALVLGGSRGLGLLLARELASRDHHVVLAARDGAEVDRAVEQVRRDAASDAVVGQTCDVRDRHAVGHLVGRVEHEVGPVEVLLVVAGIIQTGPIEDATLQQFDDAVETMAWGPINAAMTALPHLRRRGHGRIGIVTSIGGVVSPPHLLPYATAKFAATGSSRGARPRACSAHGSSTG
jgi:NAD(P)-dependent dehydrogenase (short-subunit alcohol dehydrogenase family)